MHCDCKSGRGQGLGHRRATRAARAARGLPLAAWGAAAGAPPLCVTPGSAESGVCWLNVADAAGWSGVEGGAIDTPFLLLRQGGPQRWPGQRAQTGARQGRCRLRPRRARNAVGTARRAGASPQQGACAGAARPASQAHGRAQQLPTAGKPTRRATQGAWRPGQPGRLCEVLPLWALAGSRPLSAGRCHHSACDVPREGGACRGAAWRAQHGAAHGRPLRTCPRVRRPTLNAGWEASHIPHPPRRHVARGPCV